MVDEVDGRARLRAALSGWVGGVHGLARGRRIRGAEARVVSSADDPVARADEGPAPGAVGAAEGKPWSSHRPTTRSLEPTRGPATEPYEGLGTWIDIYDTNVWERPVNAVRSMAAHGVRTIYLQSSNYHRNRPFVHAEGVEAIVDAAHRRGLEVVARGLPGVLAPPRDP